MFALDFDGDEINLHFPQGELARAEGYGIVANTLQYLSCKDGKPLRGLIQDHVDAGVLLTRRDCFLAREAYQQMLCVAVTRLPGRRGNGRVVCAHPTIMMPRRGEKPALALWTGKQVLTGLFTQLLQGKAPLSVDSKTRIPTSEWSKGPMSEQLVLVRNNELLRGVIDKNQMGASAFGIVHAVHEMYGPDRTAELLNCFGILFTMFLRRAGSSVLHFFCLHGILLFAILLRLSLLLLSLLTILLFALYSFVYSGHTCGIDDLVLRVDAEGGRSGLVANAAGRGLRTAAEHLGVGEYVADKESAAGTAALQSLVASELHRRMRHDFAASGAAIDSAMQGSLAPLSSDIIKLCLPAGQVTRFPENKFSLMVLAGAKGSLVNHSQISCCLGQQSLEGRRVPVMASGKTLPSFDAWDPSPRAGGLITDRFLSGLRPQEYYFHCMAGREGLVDTAVKTSRSGYLQVRRSCRRIGPTVAASALRACTRACTRSASSQRASSRSSLLLTAPPISLFSISFVYSLLLFALQRCLVKHLEELQVAYDYTVRDGDGAIVQFIYGDDGLGIAKANHLDGKSGPSDKQLTFLARNAASMIPRGARGRGSGADASSVSADDLRRWIREAGIDTASAEGAHVTIGKVSVFYLPLHCTRILLTI